MNKACLLPLKLCRFSGIGNEYDICMRGFLGESDLSTLKVESAEGRNFREFANFRESLYP